LVKAFKASPHIRSLFVDVRVEQEFNRAASATRVARLA
jgi:hypothetical protein